MPPQSRRPRSRALAAMFALTLLAPALAAQAPSPTKASSAAGPGEARMTLALRVLELSRASESIVTAIETGMPAQRASSPDLPSEFFDLMVTKAKAGADSLARLLAPVYADLFTEQELTDLVKFYESPLGQRMAELQPQIFVRSSEIGQKWGMQLGLAVMQELVNSGKWKP